MYFKEYYRRSLRLVHLNFFDVVQPTPEGGDIGGDGFDVDALSTEDDAVLALVVGISTAQSMMTSKAFL